MLTLKELWMVEAIVSNEFTSNNYHLPSHTESYEQATNSGDSCWTDTIESNGAVHGTPVSGKEISGVLSSLNRKGYVISNKGRDGISKVTRDGWKAYQETMSAIETPELETPELETYTKEEFYDACRLAIGSELVDNIMKLPTSTVHYLCEQIAMAQLLNELKCSETKVLRVIQVTAYNVWRGTGTHNLK